MILVRLALPVLLLAACSSKPPSLKIDQKKGTAAAILPEAERFVKQKYPEAILVGFNNHGPSFERVNRAPDVPDQSGETGYWFYFFVRNPQALADRKIADGEAVGIRFREGRLELQEMVKTLDREYEAGAAVGLNLLKTDSSEILSRVLQRVQADLGMSVSSLLHVDFNCSPAYCEVTLFEDDTKGYDVKFNPVTGEAFYPRTLTFGN